MLMNIQNTAKRPTSPHPILNLGFRIFFVGSALFAVVAMLLWLAILQGFAPFKGVINPFYWHGHEMVFGYALAVIAGFLLTAVKTWTNQPMPYGWKLFAIFLPWALARIMWMGAHAVPSNAMLVVAFVLDMLFWGLTSFAVIRAVWAARQKRQIGVVAKLTLLYIAQLTFYVGVFTNHLSMQQVSVYAALYLVIGVVFTIGRRVLPFFIVKGISVNNDGKSNGINVKQKNSALLDRVNLVGLFGFIVFDLFVVMPKVAAIFALICFIVNALRLKNWYHAGIWQKPLLWSLVIAFAGMTVSMLIFVVYPFIDSSMNLHALGLHGLALFGVGLMTVAMMARVALGHTGRNIHQPPKTVGAIFILMIVSALCRVLLPMFGSNYMTWVLVSQVAWVLSFMLFCVSYVGILSKARTDGLFG
ncbi:short-chain dehydrogenase [Moraxella bovoculi]|uniref:NnrS family protein n=1 Tax=Moraxella bovoculi TaxID=386891 RepID=UPI000624BB50|nr:NnrS family protein [Moraxella bovoculi]AKG16873.1 NnrS family protein [Moraxella bovoculi]AKG18613.1 short-chain dehydrogenase [Moraxella bovoculi]